MKKDRSFCLHSLCLLVSSFAHILSRVDENPSCRLHHEREAEQNYGERVSNPFGAIFASTGDLVVYGTVSGRILVWDRVRGCVTYELVLGQGELFSLHFLRLLMCTI